MCCRLSLTLLSLLVGTIIVLGDDALDRLKEQQSEDSHKKYYVNSITLRSNTLLTQPEKLKKCHELINIKIKPTDITENQLCEHIIEFNNWMSEQLKGVSGKIDYHATLEKTKKIIRFLERTKLDTGNRLGGATGFTMLLKDKRHSMHDKVRDVYEKSLQDETVPWDAIEEQQEKVLSTLNDAEKKEFTDLLERFTKKAEEDVVLHAHRYVNKMLSFSFGEVMPHYTLSQIPPP